jgi:hypothetical protein
MLKNSAFNAQGSRVIIVVVQVGAVKVYVAAVEALREKERQDETQVYHQKKTDLWLVLKTVIKLIRGCYYLLFLTNPVLVQGWGIGSGHTQLVRVLDTS